MISLLVFKGGNQRDLAREKAAKKGNKGTIQGETAANQGLTLEERKHRYGFLMS